MTEKNSRKKDFQTLTILAAVLLLFYQVFHKPVFGLLAAVLLVIALAFKKTAARLAALWLGFSEVLGALNTKLVLGAVYFLLLTPLAFIFRLFNKNGVNSRADRGAGTYFEKNKYLFAPADLEEPW
jgi:hypothetical protein